MAEKACNIRLKLIAAVLRPTKPPFDKDTQSHLFTIYLLVY